MDLKQELNRTINMLIAHPDNEPNSEFADIIDSLISVKKQLTIGVVSSSYLLDKAKVLVKYDYNKMLSGKWHLTEKDLNRVLYIGNSKEELINYVLNNYC